MSQLHSLDALTENESDRLHKSMRISGHTATSLAEALGVHRNTINNILKGRSPLTRRDRIAWAFATGVPVEWLETGLAPTGSGPEPDPSLPRLDSNQQPFGYLSLLHAAA